MKNPSTTRANLLLKGYSVKRFATKHRFSVHTVRSVISGRRGKRDAGKAAAIKAALEKVLSANAT